MKQLPLEKSSLIKRTFATNQFIEQLKDNKEVLHIWCSAVPLHPLPLVVVHVNEAKTCKKLRKLAPVKQLLETSEAVFVFLDTTTLMAHETEGTFFLSLHCTKEKLVFGADDFSYSWYTETKQNKVYRQKHLSVTVFINGLIAPSDTNFPVGGGYFYFKAVAYYLGILEELTLGSKYTFRSLRKRMQQLGIVLPFTKRFLLRDKDRYFLFDQMEGTYEEEDYFLDTWWDATVLLLSQLDTAVERLLNDMGDLKNKKNFTPLVLPTYNASEPALSHFVSIAAQDERIEELYVYHTREFLVTGPVKRHYFMIVFSTPDSKLTGKDLRLLLKKHIPEPTYQCSFMVISKIAAQRLLYYTQSFFKDKMKDSNCIYKKDVYAPDFHWQRTIDDVQDDLSLYYGRMEDAYQLMVLYFQENTASSDVLLELPKKSMKQLLLIMFQVYAFKALFYLDEFCHDLELFLGLTMYHNLAISGIWHRFNTTVLDLIPFFDSEIDVFVDREKAVLVEQFYKELHAAIGTAFN